MASPMMKDFGDHTHISKKFILQLNIICLYNLGDTESEKPKTYVHYHIAGSHLSIGKAGVYSKE